jgi:antitoxin ParD1/3/4
MNFKSSKIGITLTKILHPQKIKIFFDCYQILVTLQINNKIMGRNTSVSLGNHFENFVDSRVSEGRFKNASEVIRAGLRLLEEEESKIIALKNAINEGIESGIAKNFDPKKHLELLKAKKRNG